MGVTQSSVFLGGLGILLFLWKDIERCDCASVCCLFQCAPSQQHSNHRRCSRSIRHWTTAIASSSSLLSPRASQSQLPVPEKKKFDAWSWIIPLLPLSSLLAIPTTGGVKALECIHRCFPEKDEQHDPIILVVGTKRGEIRLVRIMLSIIMDESGAATAKIDPSTKNQQQNRFHFPY